MADSSFLSKGEITTRAYGRFFIKFPDGGSPTGFSDGWISGENLVLDITNNITTLSNDMDAVESRVSIVENQLSRDTFSSLSTIVRSIAANTLIVRIAVFWTAGTAANVVITLVSTGEVLGSKTISTSDRDLIISLDRWIQSSDSISFAITGASGAVKGRIDKILSYRI